MLKYNVLPLLMFCQLNKVFTFQKIDIIIQEKVKLYETVKYNHRHTTFNCPTLRTERARSDVCLGTCRGVDLPPHYVDFFDANGLKNWLLDYMRSYIEIFYKKQHNFAEKRSVSINTQSYVRDIYDGLDDNPIANVLSS